MFSILDWLLTPISGSDSHFLAPAWQWHARLMVLGWGVMIPAGILVARYCKVTPRQDWPRKLDSQRWWVAHLVLQISGCALSLVAAGFALAGVFVATGFGGTLHTVLGWAIVSLGLAQMLGGAMRGTKGHRDVSIDADLVPGGVCILAGDHFVMSVRRCVFEYVHKGAGYLALGLSVCNILIGLWMTDAPRWMWLAIPGYWVLLACLAWRFQRAGRCIDTYQAIYGPDATLPGNLRPPIGWGVRRYEADQWPPGRSLGSAIEPSFRQSARTVRRPRQ